MDTVHNINDIHTSFSTYTLWNYFSVWIPTIFIQQFFWEKSMHITIHIFGKLNSETSYSICSLQTITMSTCKSQHNNNTGIIVSHKSSGWHNHGSVLWICCALQHSKACMSSDFNHTAQHLHIVDKATVHRAAPGIPKTVGSESGVELSLTKISYATQIKSLEYPPRQFCL